MYIPCGQSPLLSSSAGFEDEERSPITWLRVELLRSFLTGQSETDFEGLARLNLVDAELRLPLVRASHHGHFDGHGGGCRVQRESPLTELANTGRLSPSQNDLIALDDQEWHNDVLAQDSESTVHLVFEQKPS